MNSMSWMTDTSADAASEAVDDSGSCRSSGAAREPDRGRENFLLAPLVAVVVAGAAGWLIDSLMRTRPQACVQIAQSGAPARAAAVLVDRSRAVSASTSQASFSMWFRDSDYR